eukprot:PhF_6_TR31198/c0_g1_i1/m.45755/K06883/K06883; uncharacterized protein
MGRHAVVVIGPAGSGKTTFCDVMRKHAEIAHQRIVHVVNMDPAVSVLPYPVSFDIRDLITVNATQQSEGLGPNGALVMCMETAILEDVWFTDNFGQYDDDYILFDFPGQVELFAQIPIVPKFIEKLQRSGYLVAMVFLLDSQTAVSDNHKYVSACLIALGAMVAVEVPFLSFLTKTDLLPAAVREDMTDYLECNFHFPPPQQKSKDNSLKFRALTESLCTLIRDFNLVSFVPLSIADEDSVLYAFDAMDEVVQYSEFAEPKEPKDDEEPVDKDQE